MLSSNLLADLCLDMKLPYSYGKGEGLRKRSAFKKGVIAWVCLMVV
jgi:hypothetical protein